MHTVQLMQLLPHRLSFIKFRTPLNISGAGCPKLSWKRGHNDYIHLLLFSVQVLHANEQVQLRNVFTIL